MTEFIIYAVAMLFFSALAGFAAGYIRGQSSMLDAMQADRRNDVLRRACDRLARAEDRAHSEVA